MIVNTPPDLTRWLDNATRGLPSDVGHMVRIELEAHYQDAVCEHQQSGKSAFEAHRAAMAELGDEKAASQALHDTHLAERRYLKAAITSIAPSILLLLIIFKETSAKGVNATPVDLMNHTVLLGILTFFAVLYVLRSFKILLAGRFNFHEIDRPIAIVKWSLLSVTISSVTSQLLFNNQVALLVNDPMIVTDHLFSKTSPPLELFVSSINIISVLALGFGWIYLSDRLTGIDDQLYGLVKPLRYLLLLNGFVIASSGVATLLGLFSANVLAVIALVVIGTSKYAVWTLLFFRAAYQGSNRPIQMA